MEETWVLRCLVSLSLEFFPVKEAMIIGIFHLSDQFILPHTYVIHGSFKFSEHSVHVH